MNKDLFDEKVDALGLKYNFIAEKLGISPQALNRKRNSDIPFTIKEVNLIKGLLNLTNTERDKIFFD